MKKLLIIIMSLAMLTGCSKTTEFDISNYWWGNKTFYGAKEISIRFLSDNEFEFKSEDYIDGRGWYKREGNSVVFDFETHTAGLGQSYIRLTSGQWNQYPEADTDVYKTNMVLTYEKWFYAGLEITTDKELKTETLSIVSRRD